MAISSELSGVSPEIVSRFPDHDPIRMNRILISLFERDLGANTFRVCRAARPFARFRIVL